jgi:hypothetical protein
MHFVPKLSLLFSVPAFLFAQFVFKEGKVFFGFFSIGGFDFFKDKKGLFRKLNGFS